MAIVSRSTITTAPLAATSPAADAAWASANCHRSLRTSARQWTMEWCRPRAPCPCTRPAGGGHLKLLAQLIVRHELLAGDLIDRQLPAPVPADVVLPRPQYAGRLP